MFSPIPVPPTYAEFPASLSLRVAIRAAGEDGMTLRDYGEIRAPVGIVAGTDGKTVIAATATSPYFQKKR